MKDVQRLTGKVAALNRFIAKLAEKCHPFFQLIRKQQNFVWNTECQQAFDQLKLLFTRPPLLDSPRINENLMIYLAVSQKAVSAVLTIEDGRLHRPIYYVSHSLHGAEERYTPMEKLAFALIIAARRLRPYFQAHTVEVLTNSALRQSLYKPETSGRMVKWCVELSEFDIRYKPRPAIKAQALADFIAECTIPQMTEERSSLWKMHIDGSSGDGVDRQFLS